MVARRRIIRAGCGRSTNNELVWLALQFDMRNRVCNKTCVCVVVARERERDESCVLESECTWRLCACAVPLRTGEEQVRVRECAVAARCVYG